VKHGRFLLEALVGAVVEVLVGLWLVRRGW
jgi:hypothetical protein